MIWILTTWCNAVFGQPPPNECREYNNNKRKKRKENVKWRQFPPIFPGLWVRLCLRYSNNNKCIDIKPRQNGSLPFLWAIASTVTRQHFLPAAPCNNNPSPFRVANVYTTVQSRLLCVYLALSVHGWLDSSQKNCIFLYFGNLFGFSLRWCCGWCCCWPC